MIYKFSDVTNLLSTNDEIQIPKRLDSKKKPRNSKKNAVLEVFLNYYKLKHQLDAYLII